MFTYLGDLDRLVNQLMLTPPTKAYGYRTTHPPKEGLVGNQRGQQDGG